MTSRERVQRAINFHIPDRVPIDLGGMKASGIAAEAYRRVAAAGGLAGSGNSSSPVKIADARFMIAEVEPACAERLHIDVDSAGLSRGLNKVAAGQRVAAPTAVRRARRC